jgi:hypothetical protein
MRVCACVAVAELVASSRRAGVCYVCGRPGKAVSQWWMLMGLMCLRGAHTLRTFHTGHTIVLDAPFFFTCVRYVATPERWAAPSLQPFLGMRPTRSGRTNSRTMSSVSSSAVRG